MKTLILMKIKHGFFKFMLFSALSILLLSVYSCYPDNSLSTSEYDIVATDYNKDYFSQNNPKTYHIPDTVSVIGDGDKQLSASMENFILDQIRRNLDELGWERKDVIDENDLPDVVVLTSALVVTTVSGGCIPWYPYWGYYPWYPGWGWGGGYCYPTYYSYQTGTLVIDMIDPNDNNIEILGVVWGAGINGLTRSSQSANQDFVRSNIDQAFKQSPYLKR